MGDRDAPCVNSRPTRAIDITSGGCCHRFRVTRTGVNLQDDGSLHTSQAVVPLKLPRTTKLYDRRQDRLTLDEVERIPICCMRERSFPALPECPHCQNAGILPFWRFKEARTLLKNSQHVRRRS